MSAETSVAYWKMVPRNNSYKTTVIGSQNPYSGNTDGPIHAQRRPSKPKRTEMNRFSMRSGAAFQTKVARPNIQTMTMMPSHAAINSPRPL